MLVTSFSPTRLEAQDKAVQSWKQQGLSFRTVQCIGEDYAKDFTDNIEWVKPYLLSYISILNVILRNFLLY